MIRDEVLFTSVRPGRALITVCVSLFNYRDYVLPALDSVARQSVTDLDLVVVDDHSDDDSPAVVRGWMARNTERFRRLRLTRHGRNGGPAAAKNTAVALAETDLVFMLDADNLIMPACLERLHETLSRSDADFAYSLLATFGDAYRLMNNVLWSPRLLLDGNRIDAMCLLRKGTWDALGGFEALSVGNFEDYDFWCKLALHGGYGILCPEVLGKYRVHGESFLHTRVAKGWTRVIRGILAAKYPALFADPGRLP